MFIIIIFLLNFFQFLVLKNIGFQENSYRSVIGKDIFAISQDQLDEVFENKEQIAVSKFYEGLPKPWSIAMKELLNDELYIRKEDTLEE